MMAHTRPPSVDDIQANWSRIFRFRDAHSYRRLHLDPSIRADGDDHAPVMMIWFELPLRDPAAAAELLARIDELVAQQGAQ